MITAFVIATIVITSPMGVRTMEGKIHKQDCGKHFTGDFPALGGAVTVVAKCGKS